MYHKVYRSEHAGCRRIWFGRNSRSSNHSGDCHQTCRLHRFRRRVNRFGSRYRFCRPLCLFDAHLSCHLVVSELSAGHTTGINTATRKAEGASPEESHSPSQLHIRLTSPSSCYPDLLLCPGIAHKTGACHSSRRECCDFHSFQQRPLRPSIVKAPGNSGRE